MSSNLSSTMITSLEELFPSAEKVDLQHDGSGLYAECSICKHKQRFKYRDFTHESRMRTGIAWCCVAQKDAVICNTITIVRPPTDEEMAVGSICES